MSTVATTTPGALLLNPDDQFLVMIDFQSQMFFATKSIDSIMLRNNAGLIASAAFGFNIPTILTTVTEKSVSGPMLDEISMAFEDQSAIDRESMNAWEDAAVVGNTTPSSAASRERGTFSPKALSPVFATEAPAVSSGLC